MPILSHNKKSKKRLIGVILLPLIFSVILYNFFSINSCFTLSVPDKDGSKSIQSTEKLISDKLISNYESLLATEHFNNKWFRYDIYLQNHMKVVFKATNPTYTEATTTLTIQTFDDKFIIIPFNHTGQIANKIPAENIVNLIKDVGMRFNFPPLIWGAGENLEMQTNPNITIMCLSIELYRPYLFIFYIEFFLLIIGIIIVFRETISFINKGFEE